MNKCKCSLCHELLYDPVSLPCGYTVCRTCFPRFSFVLPEEVHKNTSWEPSASTNSRESTEQNYKNIGTRQISSNVLETFSTISFNRLHSVIDERGYQCPVSACSMVHMYRNERQNILLKHLIEKCYNVQHSSYCSLRNIEKDLLVLDQVDILFDMNFSTDNTEKLKETIYHHIKILDHNISISPELCKLRLYRAALNWKLGNYQASLNDVYAAYIINSFSLQSNHFLQTSSAFIASTALQSQKVILKSTATKKGEMIYSDALTLSDFECAVCLNTLHEPVTKPCGHTSCKACILQSSKRRPTCPICRALLPSSSFISKQTSNAILVSLLLDKFPDSYLSREVKIDSMIERIPIFVCSLAFPGCTYGFHLFEPRYRTLIKRCMDADRCFGVCMPQTAPGDPRYPFSDFGTIVEITRFEALDNGGLVNTEEGLLPRYFIETKGKYRFKVHSKGQESAGYYFAYITRVDDLEIDDQDNLILGTQEIPITIEAFDRVEKGSFELQYIIQSICTGLQMGKNLISTPTWCPATMSLQIRKLRQFTTDLCNGMHPETKIALESQFGLPPTDVSDLAFWIAQIIPLDCSLKYKLLEENSLKSRLKIIFSWIENATVWRFCD